MYSSRLAPSWPILVYGAPRSTRVKDHSMHEYTSAQLTARGLVTNGSSSSQPYKKVW